MTCISPYCMHITIISSFIWMDLSSVSEQLIVWAHSNFTVAGNTVTTKNSIGMGIYCNSVSKIDPWKSMQGAALQLTWRSWIHHPVGLMLFPASPPPPHLISINLSVYVWLIVKWIYCEYCTLDIVIAELFSNSSCQASREVLRSTLQLYCMNNVWSIVFAFININDSKTHSIVNVLH